MPRTDAWSLLNLLPNFELIAGRKDGNGMTTPYLQRLDNTTVTMPCSEVYDGFNSAYIANASTVTVYPGVYFLNVHVKKNTDYVVGVWLKGGKGNVVVLEVCRQSAVESRPGTGRASDAQFVNYVTIEKDNEWEYHEMTVNSGAYELIEVNYWIGTNGQSAYIAKPSLQESRKGDKGDPGKQGEQGKSATSYRLQLKSGTEAKVVTNGSGDDVKFTLSAIIYYLVIKNTGGSDTEVTDAKFVATIEGKDRTVLYDTKTNKGYYLEYTGTTAYTATNTPQSAIPLTVTLADGTVLNDSIPVTIQPGVAVDIDNQLNQLKTTVADKADISTLEQTAGRISAKVASLGLRNLLMDSEFRCPVDKTIKRGGKKYREAWNNGTSVTVTDTANGISAEGVNAVKATSAVSDGDWTVTRWYVPAKSGQVYTASAWCMVPDVSVLTGDSLCLLQLFACKDDFTRSKDNIATGWFSGLVSGEWKRDTCSLTMPQDSAYTYIEVALAAYRCGTVYFRQPQLEYGSVATEWSRCAADVEGGLLATGIDIEVGKVTMTGDKFVWQNTSGTPMAYMQDDNLYLKGYIYAKGGTFSGDITSTATISGGTISGAKIVSTGDNGTTTIDGGKLTTNNLVASGGTIAGFSISGNSLVNTGFSNDASVIFRNDTYKTFAGIGGNVLPASSGLRASARFENEDSSDQWGLRANIALLLSAKNGKYNYAFDGTGNGVLNGDIVGFAYNKIVLTANTITTIDVSKGRRVIFTDNVSNTGVALPRLSDVRKYLGIDDTTGFALPLLIVFGFGNPKISDDLIFGRNTSVFSVINSSLSGFYLSTDTKNVYSTCTIIESDGVQATLSIVSGMVQKKRTVNGSTTTTTYKVGTSFNNYWMNEGDYPKLLNNDKADIGTIAMGTGDCISLLLVYDATENSYEAFLTGKQI